MVYSHLYTGCGVFFLLLKDCLLIFFGPGPLNLVFGSRVRSPDLGNAVLGSDRYGSMWTKFQLKPSIPDPNRDIYANSAYWGGGPLA